MSTSSGRGFVQAPTTDGKRTHDIRCRVSDLVGSALQGEQDAPKTAAGRASRRATTRCCCRPPAAGPSAPGEGPSRPDAGVQPEIAWSWRNPFRQFVLSRFESPPGRLTASALRSKHDSCSCLMMIDPCRSPLTARPDEPHRRAGVDAADGRELLSRRERLNCWARWRPVSGTTFCIDCGGIGPRRKPPTTGQAGNPSPTADSREVETAAASRIGDPHPQLPVVDLRARIGRCRRQRCRRGMLFAGALLHDHGIEPVVPEDFAAQRPARHRMRQGRRTR